MYENQGKIQISGTQVDSKSLQPERQIRYLEIDDMLNRLAVSVDGLFTDLNALNGCESVNKESDNGIKPTPWFASVYECIAERINLQINRIQDFRTGLSELLR